MTRRRLPTLFVLAAITIAMALPALSAGAAPLPSPVQAAASIEIRVPNYTFDPVLEGEPKLSNSQRFEGQDEGFRLVQFYGATQDTWLTSLQAAGLQVLQYYPNYTYLVWGNAASLNAAEGLDSVRWAGAFHPAYKMNSDLAGRSGVVKNVDVFFYNDGNVAGTVAALEALGAKVNQVYAAQPDKAFYIANMEMNASAFDAVSLLNEVLWFGYAHPEPVLDDEMATQTVAGNHPGGVPALGYYTHLANLGFDGTGVRWATIDTGVDYDHPDLNGHIAGGYSFPGACNTNPGEDCAGGGHGTHVTGIIGGTGQGDGVGANTDPNGYLYGVGIAPGYEIFAMNSLSAPAWPPAGGWQEHSKQAVLGGAIGGNNSWTTGEGTQHGYQASERTHDIMVLDGNFDTATVAEPFIEVFSAGNSGSSGLTSPKEGKNLIVTAASNNYRAGNIDAIASFSSRGPAVDGRWVPTIAAPGATVASTRNDLGGSCGTPIAGTNNLYSLCSGTSMAAPQTSGTITLATEWWRTFNGGADPSPGMAKALLVNGAVDMGTADIPNINEGWGRINSTNIISPSAPTTYWELPVDFSNSGESWTVSLGVADPTQPLKVTLAWADAPGAVGANPALVNNLDLTVDNGGNTYLGNVFSGGWSQTGGAADTINNLENVFVQNPGGDVTITVDAINIAGDAILYNGDPTDQSFAVVCFNCVLGSDFTMSATPTNQDICAPSDAVYSIDVGSLLGYNDPVALSTQGEPAGTTVGFSVNPVNPPGSSVLTIGNTGAAAAGSYSIDVVGVASTSTHTSTVGLNLFTAAPAAPALASPANGAINVGLTPTFMWNGVPQAGGYSIEIATDNAFTNIVDSASGIAGTSYTTGVTLNTTTTYFWRVWTENTCGTGAYSATWSFTTQAGPGDCAPGSTPNILFSDDFESGAPG
ncbi:MAG: S8 family serine peptidase, partial [Anaerolineae bacterium]|nr:S8 family serine peptidase [Anaerolineae bacterium]